jgi:paraquat-inducible protein A
MDLTIQNEVDLLHLTACHACDLLIEKQHILPGSKAVCPRCGSTIYERKSDTVHKTLAVVITILGNTSDNTLIGGVVDLYRGGFYWVSLVVFVCSMLAPFAKLFFLLIVLLHVKLDRYTKFLPALFRFYEYLDSWGILEVYMIAILVSVIKLVDIAAIHAGLGLFCFIGLLLASILATLNLDNEQIWEYIEQICKQKNS